MLNELCCNPDVLAIGALLEQPNVQGVVGGGLALLLLALLALACRPLWRSKV